MLLLNAQLLICGLRFTPLQSRVDGRTYHGCVSILGLLHFHKVRHHDHQRRRRKRSLDCESLSLLEPGNTGVSRAYRLGNAALLGERKQRNARNLTLYSVMTVRHRNQKAIAAFAFSSGLGCLTCCHVANWYVLLRCHENARGCLRRLQAKKERDFASVDNRVSRGLAASAAASSWPRVKRLNFCACRVCLQR